MPRSNLDCYAAFLRPLRCHFICTCCYGVFACILSEDVTVMLTFLLNPYFRKLSSTCTLWMKKIQKSLHFLEAFYTRFLWPLYRGKRKGDRSSIHPNGQLLLFCCYLAFQLCKKKVVDVTLLIYFSTKVTDCNIFKGCEIGRSETALFPRDWNIWFSTGLSLRPC